MPALGGTPELVSDVALWAVPAGIIGGRMRLQHEVVVAIALAPIPGFGAALALCDRPE